MTNTIAPPRKSSSKTFEKGGVCWDTSTPQGCQDIAQILEYDAKVLANGAPAESHKRMQRARALRGQPQLTGTIIPRVRIWRMRRTPRARAGHTQTSKGSASGSDGGGDPDPEPPRHLSLYSLPVMVGGALL